MKSMLSFLQRSHRGITTKSFNSLRSIQPVNQHYPTAITRSYSDTAPQGVIPLKTMIFIDGTWLYYSLVSGRGIVCPVFQKYGHNWQRNHRIDWIKFPQILAKNLQEQFRNQYGQDRFIDIIRSVVFTSAKAQTSTDTLRAKMLADMNAINFEVHCLTTKLDQEKGVDISLAVEMLYMATVPDSYDIAVIITGDKDFIPALQKTRMKGKRVAICSMRNSCNRDLLKPELHTKDFNVVWIDDYLDEIVQPKEVESKQKDIDIKIAEIITQRVAAEGKVTSRDLGRLLQNTPIRFDRNDGNSNTSPINALTALKAGHNSLRSFLEGLYDQFDLEFPEETVPDFIVKLASDEEDISSTSSTDTDEDTSYKYDSNRDNRNINVSHDSESRDDSADEDIDIKSTAAQERIQATNDGLEDMTKQTLLTMARERGLRLTGLKSDLIERIRDHSSTNRTQSNEPIPIAKHHTNNVDDSNTITRGSSDRRKPVRNLDDIFEVIISFVLSSDTQVKLSAIGRYLQTYPAMNGMNASELLKGSNLSLSAFLSKDKNFTLTRTLPSQSRSRHDFWVRYK